MVDDSRNLHIEQNRLRTFDDRWDRCQVDYINKTELAMLGFYYYGPCDLVKCHFCSVEIGMWEEGDDVLHDHIRWSYSQCPFITNYVTTNNVPIDELRLRQRLPLESVVTAPLNPPVESRSPSPSNLIASPAISPSFSISGPFEDSSFSVLSRSSSSASLWSERSEKKVAIPPPTEELRNECQICYERERQVVFLKCGHIVCCLKCSSTLTKCPYCRTPSTTMRIYIP